MPLFVDQTKNHFNLRLLPAPPPEVLLWREILGELLVKILTVQETLILETPNANLNKTCYRMLVAGHHVLEWEEGKIIVFDDSFEHEVRRQTSKKAHTGFIMFIMMYMIFFFN